MLRARWRLPSKPGAEKALAVELANLIREEINAEERLQEISTAVTEACLNAMEHGNGFDEHKSVTVSLSSEDRAIVVRIGDEGRGWPDAPLFNVQQAEIWRRDYPRGWGLLLIQQFADQVRSGSDESGHYLELRFDKM